MKKKHKIFHYAILSALLTASASLVCAEETTESLENITLESESLCEEAATENPADTGSSAIAWIEVEGVTGGKLQFDETRGLILDVEASVTEALLPDKINDIAITGIDYDAFSDCRLLTNVRLPETVNTIRASAFENCTSLSEIRLPNAVTEIGSLAFHGCTSLKSVGLPYSLLAIGYQAFEDCTSLQSVTIPSGIKTIGECAFMNCTSLKAATFGVGNPQISYRTFEGCTALTSLKLPDGMTLVPASMCKGCSSLNSLTIPAGVTEISSSAFAGCSGITELALPSGLKTIGMTAFENCAGLKKLVVPGTITSMGYKAFGGCSSLTDITLEKGLTMVGEAAFSGCTSLASITIPDGVSTIGRSAFMSCSSLREVKLPNSIRTIDYGSFSYCRLLDSFSIPDGTTTIGGSAFGNCNNLKAVYIPVSVTKVGDSPFDYYFLKDIYYGGTQSQWNSGIRNALAYTLDYAKVHYRSRSLGKQDAKVLITFVYDDERTKPNLYLTGEPITSYDIVSREGYELAGWSLEKDAKEVLDLTTWLPSEDVTLYAVWKSTEPETSTEEESTTAEPKTTTEEESTSAEPETTTEPEATTGDPETPSTPEEPTYVFPFEDVSATAYSYRAIAWADQTDLTHGTTKTTFSPYGFCSRAQVVSFLWRLAGFPEPQALESFSDVSTTSYYAKAVAWAKENRITGGTTETTFEPGKQVSRKEFISFLYRFAGSPVVESTESFPDVADGKYYSDAIRWSKANNITSGNQDGTFGIDRSTQRQEVVVFLYRYVQSSAASADEDPTKEPSAELPKDSVEETVAPAQENTNES